MDEFTNENADIQELKDRMPSSLKEIPLDMDFQYVPNNPYTLTVDTKGLGQSQVLQGEEEESNKVGFFETAGAEAAEFNVTYGLAKGGLQHLFSPFPALDIPPTGWSPKSDPSRFANVKSQYLKYVFEATGPRDQEFRLQKVMSEQRHDEVLENGSMTAKILGGFVGIVSDPMSYIPLIGWAKYAKFAPSVFSNAARMFPGIAEYSVAQSASRQANKVNGNMQNFMTEAAVSTVFSTAIFGTVGAIGLSVEKMNLLSLKKYAKDYLDGIDYKMSIDEAGKIIGLKAIDKTGGLSAEKVTFAQDLANSSFDKSGVFKVPILGEGLYQFMSMPILGTPLPRLLNSKYKTVVGIVDRIVDHNIITKGLREGETSPVKFETLMNQQYSNLRMMHAQIDALHLERNGLDISSRPAGSILNMGMQLKQKSLELIGKDLGKSSYVSKEKFYDEVQTVLRSKIPSEHSSVNEAAGMYRPLIDDTYKAWRKAYNLPEDWIPQNVLEDYLMRVYDTPFLNTNENKWKQVISNYLKESDELITSKMKPINDLESVILSHQQKHDLLIRSENITNDQLKQSLEQLDALKLQKKATQQSLENELRDNPEFFYHVEDWNALSHKEVKELNDLTKKRDDLFKQIESQREVISDIKKQVSKSKSGAMKGKTVKTAKKNLEKSESIASSIETEETNLRKLELQHDDEIFKIQERIHNGEINPRLYSKEKGSQRYLLKDTTNRLKFRDVYESHSDREMHAKAYYDTILNQSSEDTINQVMGKVTGNQAENHLKQRTLMVPDKILYDNGFMTKDLQAKVSNYVTHLSKRTNLKNVFNDVTVDGGFEPLLENLNSEYMAFREPLNNIKNDLAGKLQKSESQKEKDILTKKIRNIDKKIIKERKEFDKSKESLNHLYEKMMGIKKISSTARKAQSLIMSFTAMANLPFVPFAMINDLSANGLQHGIWPFIRDGVYPVANSLFGILKTKDSEAMRKTAPSVALALQDVLNGYTDRNWSMYTEPYLNLGKTVNSVEKLAHFSSNFTLTNYFDNGLQRISGSIVQAEFMRILHSFKSGTMTEKEGLYLRKYGIDYHKWADRMLDAFKKDGGGKTSIGGYKANFWHWQDLEAANEFSRSVYRGIKSTTIQRGLSDSPFWADNVIGSLVHGFKGWTYASLNRYVIPSMQQPDAQKLMGVLFMLGTGYFVSPFRRAARGEEAFPEKQTDTQRLYETIQDSGYFSFFMNVLADANVASSDRLLGDLKNDRYRDRTRVGLLGPAFGTANRMADVIGAASSGEMNEADLKKMFRMIPMMNASWTWLMSKKLAESLELPKTRAQARTLKEYE